LLYEYSTLRSIEPEPHRDTQRRQYWLAAHPLKHKDVIELVGVRMEFVNAPAV